MRADALGLFWRDEPVVKVKKEAAPKRTPPEPTWLRPDYLPGLSEALAFNIPQMNDYELWHAGEARERVVFDIECYPNYFLIAFKSLKSGKVTYLEMTEGQQLNTVKLKWMLEKFCLVGFNSNSYDIPIAQIAAAGKTCDQLQWATEEIITRNERGSDVMKKLRVKKIKEIDHIDLIEVAPLQASLKIYGGRLHCPRMQDLPFPAGTRLSPEQMAIVRWYCVNDLINTEILHNSLHDQIDLRETMSREYDVDLRSKSDAQIAEAVISKEVEKLNGYRPQKPAIEPGTRYKYRVPSFIKYQTPLMNWCLDVIRDADFIVSEHGNVGMPATLADLEIKIANGVYRMGIGGLHSSEKTTAHVADDDTEIIDRDVASYYPAIILNLGLYPLHLGPNFLRVYRTIVERRLHAKNEAKACKKRGDKQGEAHWKVIADSLKITINGSFGKFGSMYSVLYSPDLLIQVTVTGQLSLLMLIERLELAGISVVSANTDGIVMKCSKVLRPTMDAIVKQWELDTGFETEDTPYKALYSRDVNNYIAVKPDGTTKTKGAYANPWEDNKNLAARLHKNPTNQISVEAVTKFLTKGIPPAVTIRECTDVTKFVSVRTVKGGAVKVWDMQPPPDHTAREELVQLAGFYQVEGGYWRHPHFGENLAVSTLDDAYNTAKHMLTIPSKGEFLGKSIRWYYAQGQEGELVYALSGNKVPRSEGARPLMDLPLLFPGDVDYDWYEREAQDILKEIGYYPADVT